ncbi:MAG: hypothetical protein VW683_17165 [Betaproteobacteria bacterium]
MQTIKSGLAWVGFIALAVIVMLIARDKMSITGLTLTNAIVRPPVAVATPTLAPSAPAYVPAAPTAVPVIIAPSADNAAPMVSIAAGTVTEAQAQFLADCAFGQANGLRVSPSCPVNAGTMLGQGR